MLTETTLFGEVDKVQEAIELLRKHEPPEGYYLCFSGGKDSVVIYELAKRSGVKSDAHHNITTVEPPELVKFIHDFYPDVIQDHPPLSMYQLIVINKIPPTRLIRYCCRELKERGGRGRFKLLVSARKNHRAVLNALKLKNHILTVKATSCTLSKIGLNRTSGSLFARIIYLTADFTTKDLRESVVYSALLKILPILNATLSGFLPLPTTTVALAVNLLKSIAIKSKDGLREMICSTGGLTNDTADTSLKIVIPFRSLAKTTDTFYNESMKF